MYRYFDKHGKKTLAFFGAFLMVAFLLPTSGLHCSHGLGTHGAVAGKPVNAIDVESAHYRLESLQSLQVVNPQTGQHEPAWNRIFGFGGMPGMAGQLYQQINANTLTWFLLVSEAQQSGAAASEPEVDSFFTSQANPQVITQRNPNLVLRPLTNEKMREDYRQSVRLGLAVRDQFFRSLGRVKISRPMIEQSLAEQAQQVKARLAIFDADEYLAQIGEPTEDELKLQFEAFSSTPAGTIDPNKNPFGFGYRVPDRIKVQYFVIPASEVEAAVVKSKDDFAWEEDARVYFDKNWSQFLPPEPDPSTQPASTQPATAPVKPAFESVSDKVYEALRRPLIDAKRRTIANLITERLNDDYTKAAEKNTPPATQKIADSTVAGDVKIGSYEYLLKVRDEVQRRQHVTVAVVNEGSLLSEIELRGKPGIGLAIATDGPPAERGTFAAQYLFKNVKQFVNSADGMPGRLDLLQPSRSFSDQAATYIVRVVEADPSHAPALMNDVRDQLIKDVKRKNAFAKAVEAAEAALAKAKESGLASLSQVVYTTDWFGQGNLRIPGAPLTDAYADALTEPIFDLQRGLKSESELPRREIVKAQRFNKVAAVELFALKTFINTDFEQMAFAQTEAMLRGEELRSSNVLDNWFNADNVAHRVGYTRADGETPSNNKAPPRSPGSPFMP